MRSLARKIKDLRLSMGLNQPELAKVVGGIDQSTVSKWETGKQKPSPENILRLAEMAHVTPQQFLGIPLPGALPTLNAVRVTGDLQAGAWREAAEWPSDDQYDVPAPPSDWDAHDIHAREVVGPSMNLLYPDGSVVYVKPLASLGRPPRSGERVVVQRVSDDGEYETTLKEYVVQPDGQVYLWPRSNDPEFQAPLPLKESRKRIEHIAVIGIVVAALIREGGR